MKKRYLAIVLAALLLVSALTACGAKVAYDAVTESTGSAMAPDYYYDKSESPEMDMVVGDSMNGSSILTPETPMEPEEAPTPDDGSVDAAAGQNSQMADKIIYSANVEMETLSFDETILSLESTVTSIGGFIESSNVTGSTSYDSDGNVQILNRRAWYTVRVPAEKFNNFLDFAGELGNVISSNRNAQNVTSQYTDYEARLESLLVQEERLLEMMKKSTDINGLITLESRLSDVRYQIESVQRNLKNLDGKLAYSTVDFTIREVRVYQPTVKVQRTFLERVSDSFRQGWDNFVDGWADFVIGLAGAVFPLTVFIIVVVAVVLILCRVVKKSRIKSAERLAKLYPKKDEEPKDE